MGSSASKYFEIPKFFVFGEKGIFTGSAAEKDMNYKVVPNCPKEGDKTLRAYIWSGRNCIDKSDNVEMREFPLSEDGHAEMLKWLEEVKRLFFIAIVSNNKNLSYIEKVKKVTDFPMLFDACKPKTHVVEEFISKHNLKATDCVLVGDRPLTDILCGKRLGCKTILVDSITADTESKLVRFVRALERSCIKQNY